MPEPIDRRQMLGLGLGGAAALALAGCSGGSARQGSPPRTTTPRPDAGARRRVVVLGAGLAGLTAAIDLGAAGWDVVVLEARDRVGGRVHTIRDAFTDGLHAEAGGESIDDNHHDLQALVARFGLRTERRPANKQLDGATWWKGRRRRTDAFAAGGGGSVGAEYESFFTALAKLAEGIDPAHPERAPRAEELDARSIADFADGLHLSPEARFLVDTDNRGEFNAQPEEVSLLFAAQQIAAVPDQPDSAVEAMRITGGNDRLPQAMARSLGGRVTLAAAVTAVEHTAAGVRVHAGGRAFDGAWLVVACPLMPLRNVAFTPRLPPSVARVVGGLDLGEAAKVTRQYDARFWEAEHLSGFTESDLPFGIAWSPTDSYASEQGLLTAFITGTAARDAARLGDRTRIATIQRQLDEVYPEGVSHKTPHAATTAWANERFTGGGYAVFTVGQMVPFWPVLRQGTGRIRFAGEHTEALAGYMESAVRSGHRVAHELGAPPP